MAVVANVGRVVNGRHKREKSLQQVKFYLLIPYVPALLITENVAEASKFSCQYTLAVWEISEP